MPSDREIRALLVLIDDPDTEVYDTVATRILDYGHEIIPSLEQLWELTPDEAVQGRIEELIHRVQFQDLQQEFATWASAHHPDLLRGAVLVAKYQYPQLNVAALLNQFDQVRRNVWLEMNNFITPPEQINIINSILYSFYKFTGHELTKREAKHFFINQVLESRQGNAYTIGIIYLAICEMLDIPLFAVNIPRQFVFAYIHISLQQLRSDDVSLHKILFYVDPVHGSLFSQKDIDVYLNKLNATDRSLYMAPITNKQIIYKMLEDLCLCYRYGKEEAKADDIQQLMKLLTN